MTLSRFLTLVQLAVWLAFFLVAVFCAEVSFELDLVVSGYTSLVIGVACFTAATISIGHRRASNFIRPSLFKREDNR